MDQAENKSWRGKIKKNKKIFQESKDANSYKYSLSGKNSYSFFSFDASPPEKMQHKGKESKEYFSKPKTHKKRRKLKVEKKRVQSVNRRIGSSGPSAEEEKEKEKEEEAPLYTYSLSDKASRSHAYFWSGTSEPQQSKPLHRAESGAVMVRLGTGEDGQTSRSLTGNLLAELRTQVLSFQHQSRLLTKIFLCKISSKTFEFCDNI